MDTFSRYPVHDDVILERLASRSIAEQRQGLPPTQEPTVMLIYGPDGAENKEDWRVPIREYLENDSLGDDSPEAQRMMRKNKLYTLIGGELYKKGLNGILMKCILRTEGQDILREIHGRICGAHNSFRTLIGKAFRHGFISLQQSNTPLR